MANEDRRLAAIMFSDVCGYSKAMGEDEQRALFLVETHNNTIQAAAEQHGGRIIKTMGDGILVEFASAVNAVKCALEVQRAVSEFNRTASEEERILLRIGIHLGDVIVAGDDILGDGVNVASRIEPLAEPGGICISRDIFDLVKNNIAIEAVHLGAHELKNISKQVSIYKLLIDAVAGAGEETIVHERVRPPGSKRPLIAAAIGIGAVAIIAAVAFAVVWPKFTAKRDFENATRRARQQAEDGKLANAIATLESYPERHSDTPWQQKIDDALGRIRRKLSAQQLEQRCRDFLKALRATDKPAISGFVDPAAFARFGEQNIGFRMGLLSIVMKLATVSPNDIRIVSVELSKDGLSGTVAVELFRKTKEDPQGSWHQVPNSRWKLVDEEWYLMIEPKQPQPQQQQLPPDIDRRPPRQFGGRKRPGGGRGRPPMR